ncbi:MAG TPA: MotA/TolQ/ExbB proton channel family protein [Planctomycetota bacterium]|nr:MotA/TolQ/ExbB proton channel family protein [Planctomycetota bacterium]HPF12627.1 MotA/TolQ/ExbB proton channel family protein [Planctomycetota bacterium]HRV79785.1 MotA/TolQ/ExbB proton channel family protein [Planctomycetota bacterium]
MNELWQNLSHYFQNLGEEAWAIWHKGGWAMYALAVVALVMFSVGMNVWVRLGEKRTGRVPESTWRRWIAHPGERIGSIGRLLEFVTTGQDDNVHDMAARFHELSMRECRPFDRDLKVMKVCVSAAPLVGLLGTVTGMLSTFGALASGSGGEQTLDKIAQGISEALITTETGLVIALPGLFFQYLLSRRLHRYQAFLTHLETVCLQGLHRQDSQRQRLQITMAAKREIANVLRERLQDPAKQAILRAKSAILQR